MAIEYEEIEFAYDIVSTDPGSEAYIDLETYEIFIYSLNIDGFNELPEDVDSEKYCAIPDKKELDLGRKLVFDFVQKYDPSNMDQVSSFFRKKGAYSEYKYLLTKNDLLDKWYEFEEQARQTALREWCKEHNIELSS